MAVQPGVTPGDVTTARPGLGTTIWMQHSPPLVIDQDTFLLDWTGHFFSSPPQPPTLTSPPSSPPQPRRTETGWKQRKQTASSNPWTLPTIHITTHDIANVSTAASITMSDHWSWNTFIGHRVGKLLFPFAKSHKLNVYLRPAWRWSVHCASWQSFSQRSDLGPAPPALRSPAAATMTGGRAALLCVVKWRIELSTQFHDIWRALQNRYLNVASPLDIGW